MKHALVFFSCLLALFAGCENKPINSGEEFRPKEIHEKINYHFDNIVVDGVEYLILSRDNNNPHEGFGFMALRANELIGKQDSVLAYLKALSAFQAEIHARMFNQSLDESRERFQFLLQSALDSTTDASILDERTYSSEPR